MDGTISSLVSESSATASNAGHSTPESRRYTPEKGRQSIEWKFTPYNNHGVDDILQSIITDPLKQSHLPSGHVYIARRPEDPEYLKIGFADDPYKRIKDLRRSCLSPTYELVYQSSRITKARRVEALIHADLRPVRNSESRCKGNGNCHHQHSEWFKIDIDRAKTTTDYWINWMSKLEPYGNNGLLQAKYVQYMYQEHGLISDEAGKQFLVDSDGRLWVDNHRPRFSRPRI